MVPAEREENAGDEAAEAAGDVVAVAVVAARVVARVTLVRPRVTVSLWQPNVRLAKRAKARPGLLVALASAQQQNPFSPTTTPQAKGQALKRGAEGGVEGAT